MNQQINEIFDRYQQSGILIDTNILLLYFVGSYDIQQISKFKRTKQFVTEDYKLLTRIWNSFKKIVTTPHILTEVSNWGNQLAQHHWPGFYEQFALKIRLLEEHHQPAQALSQTEYFSKFGLTDTGIIQLVQGQYLVLTDDFRLSQYLSNIQIDTINFNHIRMYNWFKP